MRLAIGRKSLSFDAFADYATTRQLCENHFESIPRWRVEDVSFCL